MKKINILDYDFDDWLNYFSDKDMSKFRAKQVFIWLHKKNVFNLQEMTDLPSNVKEIIAADFYMPNEAPSLTLKSKIDETEKFLWEFDKNKKAESVFLPYEKRNTICISSQSGCSLNCDFCATGKLKFSGNLSTGEILSQVYMTQKITNKKISNVVFMGMGEPFYNYDSVLKAAHILNHDNGQHIGSRKISISTSGVLTGIKKYVENQEPFCLALSVHFLSEEKREKYMDIQSRYALNDIIDYLSENRGVFRNNRLMIEYIMIANENMGKDDAKKLALLAKRLNAKLNIIPFNGNFDDFQQPGIEQIDRFSKQIYDYGAMAVNRRSAGEDISAACGMLAG
ncbi:MAG: 23S rRNA (adenine(2503)-C(2))-methyltransferase RlmN [Spirochaetia bacterium]|nr:23S rRNA (adenine(2503)-C(2))-methyltransferase RlmN [Spirochaetia bacterium]